MTSLLAQKFEATGWSVIRLGRAWLVAGSLVLIAADLFFGFGFKPYDSRAGLEREIPALISLLLPLCAIIFSGKIQQFVLTSYQQAVEAVREQVNYLNVICLTQVPERMLILPTPNLGMSPSGGRLNELSPLAQLVYVQESFLLWAERDGRWREPPLLARLGERISWGLVIAGLVFLLLLLLLARQAGPLLQTAFVSFGGLFFNALLVLGLLRNLGQSCRHGAVCLAIGEQMQGGEEEEDEVDEEDEEAQIAQEDAAAGIKPSEADSEMPKDG